MVDQNLRSQLTVSDLKDYAIALEKLRQANKDDIRESQKAAHTLLNSATSNLNKNLFLVASLFVTLISAFVVNPETLKLFGDVERLLTKEAMVLTLASVVFGFMHIISESKYHESWLEMCDKRLRLWSQTSFWPSVPTDLPKYLNEYESMRKESDELQEIHPRKNTTIPILLQGVSLSIAALIVSIAVFSLMDK